MYLTENIINFYKNNNKNSRYLRKHFTSTGHVGRYDPYQTGVVDNKSNGNAFVSTVDEYNTYEINSLGLRGQVYKDVDVLASGCSITFGIGVPELGRWTNILNDKINKDVMNLGNPGASVRSICHNIIQYCMNNKMPKEIFCLMPDFFRSMVVVDKEFYKSKVSRPDSEEPGSLHLAYCSPSLIYYENNIFMQIKDKKFIEDSTSPHQLVLDAVNDIYILESFCLSNNIKLYWTTWHRPSSLILEELINLKDFKLKNFSPFMVSSKSDNFKEHIQKYCDLFHKSEFNDHLCWSKGSDYSIIDYKKAPGEYHPGIHFHHHVADFFYNLYNQDNTRV